MIPPFCPYKECPNHSHPPALRWWRHAGSHDTKCFGSVPRFLCRTCGRTFSSQTFSTNYYAKRTIDYRRLEELLASSMSIRALARTFHCSCPSILNRCDRLARQELAAHALLRPLAARHENVCIDGFVSFDRSQFFPNNLTISITSDSRYLLSFTHATLRRSGSMTESQKRRRSTLYPGVPFERRALERSFTELLDELERDRPPCPAAPLVIVTDEKLEYERAFYAHPLSRNQDEAHRVALLRVNSTLPRSCHNPLFASNYLDRELRKDQAAHRRESTCFGRNVANGLSRLACYVGWHNYRKRYRITGPAFDHRLHADQAGIGAEAIARTRRSVFTMRAFSSLIELDGIETKIWGKRFPTPGKTRPDYLPHFAFG